ncbi:MAG: aldo/keto reductase [Niabella sp.]
MEYNFLGKTGKKISVVGFGCMSLGQTTPAQARDMIAQAVDAGINYFDTADLYDKGENELLVGSALSPVRQKIILATKVGNVWRADGSGWDWNPRKNYILKEAEESLRRLQTDYIDLYQLHGGTIDDPIDETIEAFEILQRQGKILHYGISSIRPNVIREYARRSNIVSVMTQYSLLDRRPEEEVLNLLHERGISVLVRGALAQGLLLGKPAKEYLGHDEKAVAQACAKVREVAEQLHVAPTQVAMAYALQHPAVSSLAIGVRTEEQLMSILTPPGRLTSVEYEALRGSIAAKIYEQHR